MEHFLHGPYAELREQLLTVLTFAPAMNGPGVSAGLIADIANAFRSPFLHIATTSRSALCARCRARARRSAFLAEHLNWPNSVRRHGARTMIYADKLLA